MANLVTEEINDFFDEGITIRTKASVINSSSISTINFDSYRQGVELKLTKHYDSGLVKIHAGEPQHVIRQNAVGLSRFQTDKFYDYDKYNPATFINTHYIEEVNDNESYVADGALEPFVIRKKTSNDDRSVKGMLQNGNEAAGSSDLIVHVYERSNNTVVLFKDFQEITTSKTKTNPFADIRLIRNNPSNIQENDVINALSLMSGSTEGYISYDKRSSVSGFVYDSVQGTDSVAFGGMTFK